MVAVQSRGANLGVFTLALTDARRRFDPADRSVAQDLAARLRALAYDNARLYRDARAAAAAREDVLVFVAHDLRNPIPCQSNQPGRPTGWRAGRGAAQWVAAPRSGPSGGRADEPHD